MHAAGGSAQAGIFFIRGIGTELILQCPVVAQQAAAGGAVQTQLGQAVAKRAQLLVHGKHSVFTYYPRPYGGYAGKSSATGFSRTARLVSGLPSRSSR